ncbi:DUF4177 domain-containing protein [Shouchella shacheensis]|uniref:DUF4177 domain-containing protein n=1 Tax=Shouchella shacheensis TaxID=1649580 RepID=UPI0009EC7176|nr:DUF4177 domain-containing protein [Shouchella shacheensis]
MTFEYKVLSISGEEKEMEKTLNDFGKEGWELVNVTPLYERVSKVSGYQAVLKIVCG